MPVHTHVASSNLTVNGKAEGEISQPCYSGGGDGSTPTDNVIAEVESGFAEAGEADGALAPIAASLNVNASVQGDISIGATGNGSPISNVQPFTAVNWIICLSGIYPSRS